jgi:hypothetical protein
MFGGLLWRDVVIVRWSVLMVDDSCAARAVLIAYVRQCYLWGRFLRLVVVRLR